VGNCRPRRARASARRASERPRRPAASPGPLWSTSQFPRPEPPRRPAAFGRDRRAHSGDVTSRGLSGPGQPANTPPGGVSFADHARAGSGFAGAQPQAATPQPGGRPRPALLGGGARPTWRPQLLCAALDVPWRTARRHSIGSGRPSASRRRADSRGRGPLDLADSRGRGPLDPNRTRRISVALAWPATPPALLASWPQPWRQRPPAAGARGPGSPRQARRRNASASHSRPWARRRRASGRRDPLTRRGPDGRRGCN